MKQIPFNTETTQTIVDQFNRDGWIHLPGVLTGEEIAALTEGIDAVFDDPNAEETNNVYDAFSAVRLFERDAMFRDMLVREPVISLAEKLLGDDCHLIADGVVRNRPGEAVNHWHTDDLLIFPLPDEIPHHDPRMNIPNMIINFQFMLTDVPTIEYGPTEVVPGSHYSGRRPENSGDAPVTKGGFRSRKKPKKHYGN
ncbi:MAG: phytanoyl-CoA dioxygenase family protein [Lentisphaeria bacterium]|nr:phytanoyl-CoA dioxygenase family protein [Lentisphaeria bacterium]NQZ70214.1 phytanoyl-CoA dioxygenase family protein [Lentisphaeria bacterium]